MLSIWSPEIIHGISTYRMYISIVLFLMAFSAMHTWKPTIIYNKSGMFRPFGVGHSQTTILPIWLATMYLAILSYLAVIWFLGG